MKPEAGQTVRVHYRGTLDDGTQFDSSEGRDPLEFVAGAGHVIPGFDNAVFGLDEGGSTTVRIPAEEAYGPRFDEAIQQVPLHVFPDTPQPGWVVEMQDPEGQRLAASVLDVADEAVTLDFNHPLAGEALTFEIELVAIVPGVAGEEEAAEGADGIE